MSVFKNMTMTERLNLWKNRIKEQELIDYSEYIEHMDYNIDIDNQGWLYKERIVLEKNIHKNEKDIYYVLYEEKINILYSNPSRSYEEIIHELNNTENLGELILKAIFVDRNEAYNYINELYALENFDELAVYMCKRIASKSWEGEQ